MNNAIEVLKGWKKKMANKVNIAFTPEEFDALGEALLALEQKEKEDNDKCPCYHEMNNIFDDLFLSDFEELERKFILSPNELLLLMEKKKEILIRQYNSLNKQIINYKKHLLKKNQKMLGEKP